MKKKMNIPWSIFIGEMSPIGQNIIDVIDAFCIGEKIRGWTQKIVVIKGDKRQIIDPSDRRHFAKLKGKVIGLTDIAGPAYIIE